MSVPSFELESVTAEVIKKITAHPPKAVRAAKRSVDSALAPLRDHVAGLPQGPSADYASMQSGLSAFLARVTGDSQADATRAVAADAR